MDTGDGTIYKDLKSALENSARAEDCIEFDETTLESNKMLMGVLRFLLKDNAFDKEFLITTIIDYLCNTARDKED